MNSIQLTSIRVKIIGSILFFILFSSCRLSLNSVTSELNSENTRYFEQTQKIISQNCISCHSPGSINGSLSLRTEEEFVKAGWVVQGRPEASKLFYRLNGSGVNVGLENMPMGQHPLTARQINAVRMWISSLQPPPLAPQTTFKSVRIMNRKQIESVFRSVFGNTQSVNNTLYSQIHRNGSALGGPCDLYAGVKPSVGPAENRRELCLDGFPETRYTMNGGSSTLSSAWISQTCETIVQDTNAVNFAIQQVVANPPTINEPTDVEIRKIWNLFHAETQIDPAVLSAQRNVASVVAAQNPPFNEVFWKYYMLILTTCATENWAVF